MNCWRKQYYGPVLLMICILLFFSSDTQIPVSYLGIDQGLSNNSVRCILKDRKGFMWFGTHDGLNRYDGYGFKVFRSNVNDSSSLIRPLIYSLNQDQTGNLWIGTLQGLSIYDIVTERFTTLGYRKDATDALKVLDDVVRVVGTDKHNNIFLGTENLGLLFCKNSSKEAIQVKLMDKNLNSSVSILAIKKGPGNKLWVFIQNKGLYLLDYSTMTLKEVNSTIRYVRCMETDGEKIWMGTPEGIYYYDPVSNHYTKLGSGSASTENSDDVHCLSVDADHKLWIGTNGEGIRIWDPASSTVERFKSGDSRYSLSSGVVFDIFFDEQQRKWIGTQKGGVNIVDPKRKRFQVVAHDPGIPDGLKGNSITSFYESTNGNLWIGTDDAGISLWNRSKNNFTNFALPSNTSISSAPAPVTAIHEDEDKSIWIGTWTVGIKKLNPTSGNIKHYKCINPVSGIENPVIAVFYEDKAGTLWATGLRQGNRYAALYYYNREADRYDAFDVNLSDLFALTEDRHRNFWGGNLKQLIQIDRINKQHRFYHIGFAIRAIHEDKKGRFWVGTDGGGIILFNQATKKVQSRYTTENGLSNNSVLNILEDNEGNLWISTLNGLSKFNPEKTEFSSYYYNDGLQSNQFNQNAAIKLKAGELAFGGIKGFNIFRPTAITVANEAPPIALTSLKINNNPLDFHGSYIVKSDDEIIKLKIPYDQAILTFDFAALEYSAPEKISYAYYLEGWDRSWNYIGALRTANYTHLTEGSYVFRVKSTNAEGQWMGKEVVVEITVMPPWFRSWWAIALYLATGGSIVYILWLYRIRQAQLKYEVEIAKVNVEKEKIEKEKHQAEYEKEKAVHEADRVISEKEKELNQKRLDFFTNITHEFRTPLTLIINPAKDLLQQETELANNNELSIIYRNARRMLSLVDQLLFFRKAEVMGLDNIRPAKLNFYNLCYEVYLCFVQQAKSRNIDYKFICQNSHLELYVDREKMEIVLYNLLSNAMKYTPHGGSIMFEIIDDESIVNISVTDSGTGIPLETGDKLFDKFYKAAGPGVDSKPGFGIGLYLVRQFAEAHLGSISYISTPGQGTSFLLSLLKGKEHFDPAVLISDKAPETAFLDEITASDELVSSSTLVTVNAEQITPIITDRDVMLVVDDDKARVPLLTVGEREPRRGKR